MFEKGPIKGEGIDISLNNPDHFLALDDHDMVLKARCHKVSPEEYRQWYVGLIKRRWQDRKKEFLDLASKGREARIKLKCHCTETSPYCHGKIAADFMNALASKIPS